MGELFAGVLFGQYTDQIGRPEAFPSVCVDQPTNIRKVFAPAAIMVFCTEGRLPAFSKCGPDLVNGPDGTAKVSGNIGAVSARLTFADNLGTVVIWYGFSHGFGLCKI